MALTPEFYSVLSRFGAGLSGPVAKPSNSLCDVFARVPDAAGNVSWTPVWEPLESGDSPSVYPGVGPVAVGQVPTVLNEGWDAPAQWWPNDPTAVAVVNFHNSGVLYLYAALDGAPLPGRLVMTVMGQYEGDSYPNVTFAFEGGGEPTEQAFWIDHRNTYEIP